MKDFTLDILTLTISCLTPLVVLIIGYIISKKIENNKLILLKEKEWQVKWAELFFEQAIDYNNKMSSLITMILSFENKKYESNSKDFFEELTVIFNEIKEIDWNISIYAQFSKDYGSEVIKAQGELTSGINEILEEKGGDFELLRKKQFNYNKLVSKAHSQILKM